MGSGPIDPLELLKGLDNILSQSGEVKALEGMAKIFNLMKQSQKMVNRCIYLNIVLQTHSPDILSKFIRVGGYKLLNSWMTYARTCNNSPLLHQILLTLQHLPLTVDHLKQNNTAKLVKQLSKSSEDEELRKLAGILVNDWMAVIRSQSNIQPADKEKKKKKEDPKGCSPVPDKTSETKSEDSSDKKKEKPKTLRTSAPSHAKFRSTGLEVEAPSLVPVKKPTPVPVLSDKYLKPIPVKRQSSVPVPGDAAPAEKKYKPLNTVPNTTKEIKVKIIPPQPMESLGFLDALNSAPVTGMKIKKKKKASSPTSNKPSPFDSKSPTEASSLTKPSSPEPEPPVEGMEVERPGTPVPAIELPEPMEISAPPPPLAPSETKPNEADASLLTKKGKKRKTVSWPEESRLREYFYFELDETERVNVNKIKDFGEAAKREMMKDRQAFQNARRLSHDTMEEVVPWVPPRLLSLPGALVQMGSNSTEKHAQAEREMGILQEIFLSKESVPDTPHEPDPESYEPSPPKLIPLDEDCSMDDGVYPESMDQSIASQSPDSSGAKLPPVLANLMGSMGSSKSPPNPLPGTMQEILTSIMGAQGNANPEDLMKQPDLSEKIKHLLGSLQNQNQNQGPPGPAGQGSPGSVNNGFSPPSQKNYQPPPPPLHHQPPPQHYPPPGPNGPFQGPHGPPGGPRMMGPPPPQRDGYWEPPPNENMRGGGGHHGGGMRGGDRGPPPPPFHRNRGGRGGEPGYRGRGRGGERGHPGRNGPYGMGHGDHRGHGGHGGEHRGRGEGHRGRGEGHRGHGEGHRGHGEGHRGHGGHGDHRGHGHGGDMSTRPTCRHFMMKGNCRYENNCAFYHPGINGPPLP